MIENLMRQRTVAKFNIDKVGESIWTCLLSAPFLRTFVFLLPDGGVVWRGPEPSILYIQGTRVVMIMLTSRLCWRVEWCVHVWGNSLWRTGRSVFILFHVFIFVLKHERKWETRTRKGQRQTAVSLLRLRVFGNIYQFIQSFCRYSMLFFSLSCPCF